MNFIMSHNFDSESKRWEIVLNGEIDIFNSMEFKNQLLGLLTQNPGSLVLDCDKLEYIDSTALGALVTVLKHVKSADGQMYLKKIRPNLAKLFKITSLDKVFIIEGV